MRIEIADKNSASKTLSAFFQRNLTSDYISHAELQGYRAIKPGVWAPNLSAVLNKEIEARLGPPLAEFPVKTNWRGVIVGKDQAELVSLALVTSVMSSTIPHGIVEDIVVEGSVRSRGHGETMMRWIIDRFRLAGINRVFLESGVTNDDAHHFFERLGFKQVSIVMMLDTVPI
jgi:ribosomal protein S18 acetylase RimI-like enzyme